MGFLSAGLLLVAAKSHGRQVRVEREAAGYPDADVRSNDNPTWVLNLWRRDRIRFWTTFLVAASLLVPYAIMAPARSWPLPGLIEQGIPGTRTAVVAFALLLWAPVVGFFVAGLSSLHRVLGGPTHPQARRVARGSLWWWTGATALAATVTLLAFV